MNKLYLLACLLLTTTLFTSCGSGIFGEKVLIYNNDFFDENGAQVIDLVIDEETVVLDTSGMFTELTLTKGEHAFATDGLYPEKINIPGEGLLYSGKNEFIVYPVEYITCLLYTSPSPRD